MVHDQAAVARDLPLRREIIPEREAAAVLRGDPGDASGDARADRSGRLTPFDKGFILLV
jgi:hypothetical protein